MAGLDLLARFSLRMEANVALTGRFNFRKTLRGKVVLQLEEDVKAAWPRKRTKRRWRDANLMDLARPELRPLIDLRSKPNYHAASYKLEELELDQATMPQDNGRISERRRPLNGRTSPNGDGRLAAR